MDCAVSSSADLHAWPSVEAIIRHCRSPNRHCIHTNGRSEIISLGSIAIKVGRISAEEIRNQCHAWNLLDPSIVRIPQIYSCFTKDGDDYVVMENICGQQRQIIEDQQSIDSIATIVNHLHTFISDTPGPVDGGNYSGPLWSEDDHVSFTTKSSLESFVRSRLKRQCRIFTMAETPLVLTHGDVAPRNLIFGTKSIWLLDWEFAGYFPRSAEIATLRLGVGNDTADLVFHHQLERAILRQKPLKNFESEQVSCWQELAVNNVRFYWPTESEKCNMHKRPRRLNGSLAQLRQCTQESHGHADTASYCKEAKHA